ncbi:MAG TPA: Rv3235 family protein [Mycobacteriales bacterium]|nr:Rv3235 family protein [Mycobacteriales bacterium]
MQLMLSEPIASAPEPVAAPTLRLVPPLPQQQRLLAAPQPPTLPRRDPRPVAENFARGVAEVLVRARNIDQLRDLATFEVIRIIERAAGRQPVTSRRPVQPRLRSVRLGTPTVGVIEACAVVDGGVRTRAFAFRLEYARDRWRCTELQLG